MSPWQAFGGGDDDAMDGCAVAAVMLVLGPGGSLAAPPAPTAIGVAPVVLVSYHIASGNDQLAALFSRGAP